MTTHSQVQGHPASVDAYIRHGWKLVPIPPGTKGPTTKGWNRQENALVSAANLPHGYGIGLAHAYSGTMALDVDDWDRASVELAQHGIDLQGLYDAPDAVTIESGRPGHGKLLYSLPFGLTLPTKKINYQHEGQNRAAFELRCATSNSLTVQDVLPPSIHPDTQQPYRWGGKGNWSRLPVIPHALLQYWQSLIEQDSQRTIPTGSPVDTSWDEIRTALYCIPPDINRDEWVHIGMALQKTGTETHQEAAAYHLWDEWSSTGIKYQGQRETASQWQSFKADRADGVTLGTLFKLAKDHGWTKPVPSADEIFKDVQAEATSPVTLTTAFRPPPPEIDISLFPDILATRSVEIAKSMGADPLTPLFAGLATISGAVNAETRLELMPGFRVPPILWLATIGDPAEKKSPASKPMKSILSVIEKEDRPRYKEAKLQWDGQEAAYTAAYKNYLNHYSAGDAILDNDVGPSVPDLPEPPAPLKITVQDITSQKLVRVAAERPRGVLCWLDEMNSWVRKLSDTRSGEDRSTWVQGFEGDSYEMDRVGAGSVWCDNLAVSIYGNIQPRVLRQNFDTLTSDGLLQRFIPAILHETSQRGEPLPDAFSHKDQWDQVVRQAFALPKRTYTLSPDAYNEYREFQSWYEGTKVDERRLNLDGEFDGYMTAFGKLEGQCGRLALILHVIESPHEQEVSGDLMRRTVEIVKSYVVPALRYLYSETAGLSDTSLDVWAASHILALAGMQETVSLRDLKHSARRKLAKVPAYQKDAVVVEAMTMLEACNWVRLIEGDMRRSQMLWAINPELATAFEQERLATLKVKQKRLDENREKTKGRSTKRRIVPGYDPETMD